MAQAKKKAATKTAAKKSQVAARRSDARQCEKKQGCEKKQSNLFFVMSMTFLVATLLVMDLFMINL